MCQNMIVILPWKKERCEIKWNIRKPGVNVSIVCNMLSYQLMWQYTGHNDTHIFTWGANTQGKFVWSDMIKRGCTEKETKEEKKSDFIFIFGIEMHCHLSEMSKQTSTRGRRRRRRRQSMSSLLSWVLVIYIFLITRAYLEQTSSHSHLS